jgi:thiamine transport system permease protein
LKNGLIIGSRIGKKPFGSEVALNQNTRDNGFYSIILVLFYLPVLTVLGTAILHREALASTIEFLLSPVFRHTLSFSVTEALASAGWSLLLALPGAYFFGRYDFPGKRLWRSAMVLPFMMPGILIVLGMVACFGVNGTFNHWWARLFPMSGWKFTSLYGFWGIVMANTYYNFSFCLRVLGESWERINPAYAEASLLLGGGSLSTWRRVILPLLTPTIAYLFTLVFLYSFLSFTVVLVLGGFLYQTFEVLIYIEYNSHLQFDRASLMAGIQMLLLAGVVSLQFWFARKMQRHLTVIKPLPQLTMKTYPRLWGGFTLYKILILSFFLAPLLSIVSRSLKTRGLPEGGFTLENYRGLFDSSFRFVVGRDLGAVILTSLATALIVGMLAVFLAYGVAEIRHQTGWRPSDLWFQLPVGISFLTFAFGILRLAGDALPPWFLVVWAQVFLAFPLSYSILRNARRELSETMIEAAMILGAPPYAILSTVKLPLIRKALCTALAFAMAFSLGDLGAVLVLGRGEVCTLSVAIYRLIGHYHYAQATALGTVFMLISIGLYFLIEQSYLPGSRQAWDRRKG